MHANFCFFFALRGMRVGQWTDEGPGYFKTISCWSPATIHVFPAQRPQKDLANENSFIIRFIHSAYFRNPWVAV